MGDGASRPVPRPPKILLDRKSTRDGPQQCHAKNNFPRTGPPGTFRFGFPPPASPIKELVRLVLVDEAERFWRGPDGRRPRRPAVLSDACRSTQAKFGAQSDFTLHCKSGRRVGRGWRSSKTRKRTTFNQNSLGTLENALFFFFFSFFFFSGAAMNRPNGSTKGLRNQKVRPRAAEISSRKSDQLIGRLLPSPRCFQGEPALRRYFTTLRAQSGPRGAVEKTRQHASTLADDQQPFEKTDRTRLKNARRRPHHQNGVNAR